MIFLQLFAGGTDIEVALWIEGEVAPGEGSVRALGLVHQFHMRLGQLVGGRARHFMLMTATPHNGDDASFQLFMGLLDPDRFEGRPREGRGRSTSPISCAA